MSQDHDALFRHTFSHPEHAASLLRSILAADLAAAIDWDRLELLPGTFVDEDLRTRQADLLFAAPMHGVTTLLHVLLEHKSGSDRWAVLQLLRYVVRIYDRWRQEHPDAQQLPPILPIVVHHGERPWSSPQRLADLIDLGSLTGAPRERLAAAQPQFTFLLEDLAAIDEQQLRGRTADEVTRLVLLLLQCAQAHRSLDPVAIIERWLELFAAAWHHPLGRLHVVALLSYMYWQFETTQDRLEAAAALIHDEVRTMGKSLAERLIEQGREKGIAKGKAEGIATGKAEGIATGKAEGIATGKAEGKAELLRHLLIQRFGPLPADLDLRLRDAEVSLLDRWAERLFTAQTPHEVFA
jgi:predicted transposase/invertase (TIGR01784 family)